MMTLAAMAPPGSRRRFSGRRPSTTSGPAPRSGSPTSGGSGTDAAREGHAEHAPRAGALAASDGPLWTSIPSSRFMPGLPRKWATNALAGLA